MKTKTSHLGFIAGLLLISLFVLLAYTTLHEGGHALAGLAFGGIVTEFNVNFFDLSAHVGIDGQFTRSQNAFINVAGVSLPLLFWIVSLLLLPKSGSPLLRWAKLIATMGWLNTLLAWIIIPFLYLNNSAPPSDDVTQFIRNSGLPALAVALGALTVYALGWGLFALRIGSLRDLLIPLRGGQSPGPAPLPRGRIVAIVLAALTVTALAGWGVFSLLSGPTDPAGPPPGYSLVAEIPLSERGYQSEVIYRFPAHDGQLIGVFVQVEGIDTAYIDLALVGADGQSFTFLHGEEFRSDASISQGNFGLAEGEAQIVLTSAASAGTLKVYLDPAP